MPPTDHELLLTEVRNDVKHILEALDGNVPEKCVGHDHDIKGVQTSLQWLWRFALVTLGALVTLAGVTGALAR